MASVREHYENLLAAHYSWMSGGSALKVQENRDFFRSLDLRPEASKEAVDLGAGSGFQSIPLAEAGFSVTAVDLNRTLLQELEQNTGDLAITTVHDDILHFPRHSPAEIEIIVCMGDTLTHLRSLEEVYDLLTKAYRSLAGQGRLILTFRDMTSELTGVDRFIPVRSDANRIFTCFLEYEAKYVKVHDILYERIHNHWQMEKSFYRKLRISPAWTRTVLEKIGFRIDTCGVEKGMATLVAQKA
jgi:SAM-dependent methyltransferase